MDRLTHVRICLVCLLLGAPAAYAVTLDGYVVRISDGDTLTLVADHRQHQIRLAGIDAPERFQPYGSEAAANLGRLAFNKRAEMVCSGKDRHGRDLCKLVVDGRDVGLQQIAAGLAWWYEKYAKLLSPEERAAYARAETMAKLRRLGLWAGAHPVPPWAWRRGLK